MMIDDTQSAEQFLPARPDKKPAPVDATDCPAQIAITVNPDKHGRYRAYVEAEQEPLCVSRQPFLDGARKLLATRARSPDDTGHAMGGSQGMGTARPA